MELGFSFCEMQMLEKGKKKKKVNLFHVSTLIEQLSKITLCFNKDNHSLQTKIINQTFD